MTQTTCARNLRHNQTDAETRLWWHLRNRNLAGFKFRRQHPVGPYITDFACLERMVIVELDGGQHAEQEEEDLVRSSFLEGEGFKVLRFWNHEVLTSIEAVLERILEVLEGGEPPSPRPSP